MTQSISLQKETIRVSRDTVVAGLLAEAMDRGPGATSATRLKAWELVAKVCGLLTPQEEGDQVPVRFNLHLAGRREGDGA